MAEPASTSGHLSTGKRPVTAESRPSGSVTKHHQLALDKTDGMNNVQGVGNASTKSTIANGGKKGW